MDERDIDRLDISFTSVSTPLTDQKLHCIPHTCARAHTHARTHTHMRAITTTTIFVDDIYYLCSGYVILGMFAKPIHSSTRLALWNNENPTKRIFLKFYSCIFYGNFFRSIMILLNSKRQNRHFTRRLKYLYVRGIYNGGTECVLCEV